MPLKILFVEIGTALEMGIPPNLAILTGEAKQAGFQVELFSANRYKYKEKQGDQTRIDTLQLPPTIKSEIKIEYKKTNIFDDFKEKISKFKPDIIAFSITEISYLKCIELVNIIEDNNIFVIIGGVYAILNPDQVIENKRVNAICIGEGEKTFVKLCHLIQNKKLDYNTDNFWFRNDSQIIKNKVAPLANMEQNIFQDWSCWEMPPRSYKIMNGKIGRTALIELSRGCLHNCSFCANCVLNSIFKKNYRERSIKSFIKEINHLKKQYDLSFIYIVDENFLATSKKRFNEFIKEYEKIKIPFWIETRPELITIEKIQKLKKVGLEVLNIGIEQGDDNFRKTILNRRVKDEDIIRAVQICSEEKVRIGVNIIIGFPTETREHIFKTINLVKKASPDFSIMHLFQPYIKTPLRQKCLEMNLIDKNFICEDHRLNGIPTGYLSVEELQGLMRTFNLYINQPEEKWTEIEKAEKFDENGNNIFKKLAKEYQLKHFNRTSF